MSANRLCTLLDYFLVFEGQQAISGLVDELTNRVHRHWTRVNNNWAHNY